MATAIIGIHRKWSGGRDKEGNRTYKITFQVVGSFTDGPYNALNTPGLPVPGAMWNFGDDVDPFAYCTLDADVTQAVPDGEGNCVFYVTFTFATKFGSKADSKYCKDQRIDNPLLQPPEISISSTKYQKESLYDRFGKPIVNVSWEPISGPQGEWDEHRLSIRIKQNVVSLQQELCAGMMDRVNKYSIWGFPPRCVKLSGFSATPKWFGQCFKYYERSFDFEVRYEGFDRDILNEGSKVLNGKWHTDPFTGEYSGLWERVPCTKLGLNPPYEEFDPTDLIEGEEDESRPLDPNPKNPQHFTRFKDRKDENSRTLLNYDGTPYAVPINVTTCSQCPGGAPKAWVLRGFGGLRKGMKLKYISGCRWEGMVGESGPGTGTSGGDPEIEDPDVEDPADEAEEDVVEGEEYEEGWWLGTGSGTWTGDDEGVPAGVISIPTRPPIAAKGPKAYYVALYYLVDRWRLEITTAEGGDPIVIYNSRKWNCLGPNIMNRTEGRGPRNIGLSMEEVPSLHFEKYLEANFLILGIPASL